MQIKNAAKYLKVVFMEYVVKAQEPANPKDESPKGWYRLFLENSEEIGDIFLSGNTAFLKIFKKGKRDAHFSKKLVESLNSGRISDEIIEESILDITYNCECEPCGNPECPYNSTIA